MSTSDSKNTINFSKSSISLIENTKGFTNDLFHKFLNERTKKHQQVRSIDLTKIDENEIQIKKNQKMTNEKEKDKIKNQNKNTKTNKNSESLISKMDVKKILKCLKIEKFDKEIINLLDLDMSNYVNVSKLKSLMKILRLN